MSEGKFHIVVKLNLPPEMEYHSGHSIIVQADSIEELVELMTGGVTQHKDNALSILKRFGEFALKGAAESVLKKDEPAVVKAKKQAAAIVKKAEVKVEKPEPPVDDEPAEVTASAAQLAVVAKKLGKKVADLGPMTVSEAKAVIKGE